MPCDFRTWSSCPACMLFCFSICARALLISSSVAVTFCRLASCICSFSSTIVRSTWAATRCRVSGESVRFDDSITILRREVRSPTEITSSLTTAAIRVSVTRPSGDGADGRWVTGGPGGDPEPGSARAALAGPEKQVNPASPMPSPMQSQRSIAIGLNLTP